MKKCEDSPIKVWANKILAKAEANIESVEQRGGPTDDQYHSKQLSNTLITNYIPTICLWCI